MSKSVPFSSVAVVATLNKVLRNVKKISKEIKKPDFLPVISYQHRLMLELQSSGRVEGMMQAISALDKDQLETDVAIDSRCRRIDLLTKLKVNVKWLKKGHAAKAGKFVGVELDSGFQVLDFITARIQTKSGDIMYMSKMLLNGNGYEMTNEAFEITKKMKNSDGKSYSGLIFPKLGFSNREVSLRHLIGMEVGNVGDKQSPVFIDDADKSVSFSLDEVGAKVKVEVQVKVKTKSMHRPSEKFVIDGPYSLWMVSKGQSFPYFVCNCGTDDFKKA